MQLKDICVPIALGCLAAPAVAVAAPQFLAYEGRNAIHEGQGGNKKVVQGIDFWVNGDPPHRFKVIGAITDRRLETGIYGAIRMSGLEYDIAKTAKAASGDAVILEREGEDLLAVSGFGNAYASGGHGWASAFGSSYTAPIKAHEARYVVVTYLPDEPSAAVTPTAPAPAATTTPTPSPALTPASAPVEQPAPVPTPIPATAPTARQAAAQRRSCIRVVTDPTQGSC